jgi:hypothetical protein
MGRACGNAFLNDLCDADVLLLLLLLSLLLSCRCLQRSRPWQRLPV